MAPPATDPNKQPSNSFIRYSGFAFQLLGGLGVAGWIGYVLDKYLGLSFPAFMLLFILSMLAAMMYYINRKLNEEK